MKDLDTNDHWEKWGQRSPYFGVLTDPVYSSVSIGDERWQAFMDTGEAHVEGLMAHLDRHGMPTTFDRALDFGCGVGRLLAPLARRSGEAVGVDVSEAMRSETRQNLATLGLDNAEVVASDDELAAVTGTFDLVHCYNVLQHVAPDRGLAISRRMLERSRPGGVVVLHYCTSAPALKHRIKRLTRRAPFVVSTARRLRGKDPNLPIMQMFEYPPSQIFAMLLEHGIDEAVVQLVEYNGNTFIQLAGSTPA